jgi:hypothetical protein
MSELGSNKKIFLPELEEIGLVLVVEDNRKKC